MTIPRDLRELAGISANSEVIFGVEDGKITIVPKDGGRVLPIATVLRALWLRSIGLREPETNRFVPRT